MSMLVDQEKLLRFINIDLMGEQEIFEALVEKMANGFNDLRGCPHDGSDNLQELAHLAHRLKSGCRSFAAVGIEQELVAIEGAIRAHNNTLAETHFQKALTLISPTLEEIKRIFAANLRAANGDRKGA